jgi:hypothetical protein
MNVKGGTTVTVLWLMNAPSTAFEDSLPPDTTSALETQRAASLGANSASSALTKKLETLNPFDVMSMASFPMVDTLAMEWPVELVGLVQQQASWTVYNAKKEVGEMVRAAAVPQPDSARDGLGGGADGSGGGGGGNAIRGGKRQGKQKKKR